MAKKNNGPEDDIQQLPGMEDVKDTEVHNAAIRYWERMQERKEAGEEEVAAQESLIQIMDRKGMTSYRYKDVEVHIDSTRKAKVKRKTPDQTEE